MGFTDKNLTCADCNKEFIFSTNEQEFFASKGFTNEPKRCPDCREARKSSRGGGGVRQGHVRQMYPTVCAQCGKQAEIPFEPRSDRPVYCSECYSSIRPKR
jgi:CxxC-x17-CxxC domain-containing protein